MNEKEFSGYLGDRPFHTSRLPGRGKDAISIIAEIGVKTCGQALDMAGCDIANA